MTDSKADDNVSETEQDNSESSPKLVVDSDWKEQVAKEKEALKDTVETMVDELADVAGGETEAGGETSSGRPTLPPASFEVLISMLFTQGMSSLGQIPMPGEDQPTVDKAMAKHAIDTMEVLSEKTKGNLNDAESKMLAEATHALRMAYVSTRG